MNFAFPNPFRANPAISNLPAPEAIKLADKGGVTLIDVREVREVMSSGRAKGAINIPMFMLQQKADPNHPEVHPELALDKPVMIYCASGARSGAAARTLAAFGYETVYNIGGLGHWHAAGGALER